MRKWKSNFEAVLDKSQKQIVEKGLGEEEKSPSSQWNESFCVICFTIIDGWFNVDYVPKFKLPLHFSKAFIFIQFNFVCVSLFQAYLRPWYRKWDIFSLYFQNQHRLWIVERENERMRKKVEIPRVRKWVRKQWNSEKNTELICISFPRNNENIYPAFLIGMVAFIWALVWPNMEHKEWLQMRDDFPKTSFDLRLSSGCFFAHFTLSILTLNEWLCMRDSENVCNLSARFNPFF